MRAAHARGTRLVVALALAVPLGCGDSNPHAPEPPAAVAPTISTQPADVVVDVGGTATFAVAATGTGPLSYQWKRGGASIAGATAATYSVATVAAADDQATFSVDVSNAAGRVESRAARLTVRTPPRVTTGPQDRDVPGGVPATFTVEAAGYDLAYQWLRDGSAIPGATAASYAVGVPMAGDDGARYAVVVTNPLGVDTSAAATLRVQAGPGLRPTSYANAKGRNVRPIDAPGELGELGRAFAGFFGDHGRDLFLATMVYGFEDGPDDAPRGEFQLWRWTGSRYVEEAGAITGDAGCVHPRKAAVADFNGDDRPDVFLACHGYDQPPFPGEPSYVVLSQAGGGWVARPVLEPGFYHNATAADVDGDGDADVVVTDNFADPSVFALLNDGQGGFTARPDLLPFERSNYFTVEMADVDGDGLPDLLAGGHEWEGAPTVVLINDGSGSFADVAPVVLPAVPNEGVVLDFVVLDADRDGVGEVYVLRTSGGDGTFYQSRTVQRVHWPSLASTVPLSQRGMDWIPYVNPFWDGSSYALVSDIASLPFELRLP